MSMTPCRLILEFTTNEHGLMGDGVPNWNAAVNSTGYTSKSPVKPGRGTLTVVFERIIAVEKRFRGGVLVGIKTERHRSVQRRPVPGRY